MLAGDHAGARRLPFRFEALGGVGRLTLADLAVGPMVLDRMELEVSDLGTDPGGASADRFQRKRTRLRALTVRISAPAIEERVEAVRRQLSGLGITHLQAKLNDGFLSVRARAADGLAAADISFRVLLASAGTSLRAVASTIRVHGHLPTPGPVIVDRILTALLAATDTPGVVERPHVRGLCDVEIDLVGALLWHVLPPAGWRLPAVTDVELVALRCSRSALEVEFGPAGSRTGELGVRAQTHQLAATHDLMHSADEHLRDGQLEDAMRGYRALLAAGGPEQPLLLDRILSLAAARPAWFFDGLELSRQALGRWPSFPAAHAALASITLAQGDAREAAGHLTQLAQLASAEGDDDQAALAALAGARLLRVLDPRAATQLYQLALEHDPGSTEAADSLADRLADEGRWTELVRLVRARAAITSDAQRAVQLRLRLADVFVHHLDDPASAQQELAIARHIAPDDPAVHEMTATVMSTVDPVAAIAAWREVARLAETREDHRTTARALAIVGDKLAANDDSDGAHAAWTQALEHDPLQADALAGLAQAAAGRGDHATAAELYERLRGLGLAPTIAARHELALARALVAIGRTDDARASLRRATLAGGETAAEAHAVLAEVAEAADDREHAAAELDTAIGALVSLGDAGERADRMYTRAAELALARAALFDRSGQAGPASAELTRAHELAARHAPTLARDAARAMLDRVTTPPPANETSEQTTQPGHDWGTERQWIDAVLATRPPMIERAQLLVRRAAVRRNDRNPDLAAALADLHEALRLVEAAASNQDGTDPEATVIRRRTYQLEAEILAQSGDQRARAQALSALARMSDREQRVEVETAAAAAWLAADEPAAALPHGARAHAALEPEVPSRVRRDVLVTLGEAAWRQRAWPDVIRAYRSLITELQSATDAAAAEAASDPALPRAGVYRYRLAVAADRTGDPDTALDALRPLVGDGEEAHGTPPELRGQALRLFADLAERSGDLRGAATALEGFAALAVDSSPTARADAMYRAGELFRRADRGEDAIRCLEAALRISETHLPALDALELAWRERNDLERVSVILGRKVAATARHPARQKPLLSRLGDLQDQLGRPDVALATHQRALEIDPQWRPSLKYVTQRLRSDGNDFAAVGGLVQLSGELPGDAGIDAAAILAERRAAAAALGEIMMFLDGGQVISVEAVVRPALERAATDGVDVAAALARLRGDAPVSLLPPASFAPDENTQSGRAGGTQAGALSLKDAALRARVAGKLDDAFATLEAANHVNPGDIGVLQQLVEIATELKDHAAAAKHLSVLADLSIGARRGNALLELAELYYDHIDDAEAGRKAMRAAADAFGVGARRDATLRMLASEARANLAWDIAVEALAALTPARRTATDITDLAWALVRAGKDAEAVSLLEDAQLGGKLPDADAEDLLRTVRGGRDRKAEVARQAADPRTKTWPGSGGAPAQGETLGRIKLVSVPRRVDDGDTKDGGDVEDGFQSVSDPNVKSGPVEAPVVMSHAPQRIEDARPATPDPDATLRDLPRIDSESAIAEQMAEQEQGEARKPPTLPPSTTLRRPASVPPPPTTLTLRDFPSVPPPMGASTLHAIPPPPTAPPQPTPARTLPPSADLRSPFGDVRAPRERTATAPPPDRMRAPSVAPTTLRDFPAPPSPDHGDSDGMRRTTLRDFPSVPPPPGVTPANRPTQPISEKDRRLAAHVATPDDADNLVALLALLADSPAERREVLESTMRNAQGLALAIALFELAMIARENKELIRAAALLTRAHEVAPDYAPVWMPLADALAASDELASARELYERVAESPVYDDRRRAFATERANALGFDHSIVSGEIKVKVPPAPPVPPEMIRATELADAGDVKGAIALVEQLIAERPDDTRALELMENLYLRSGNVTGASDAIGRQLSLAHDEKGRAALWLRRAKLYKDTLDRDAEAYRCLKEAHAAAPSDPEIAYQLRTAAMVRGEWPLAASLLYREIAAAKSARDRGALHLELALIFDERLDDEAQAQVNYEQALAFDPSIPAAKLPLARRYEATGRYAEAARLYDEAAATARAADRARLLEAVHRCQAAANLEEAARPTPPALATELERALVVGETDRAVDLAHQLWRAEPGNAAAFRVIANAHRMAGDLAALSDLTSVRASRAESPEDRAAAWLEVARLAEDVGALDQAARAYDLALVEDPGHTVALDARGALAFRLSDWATADTIYRDISPGDSMLSADDLALRRSLIAEKLGRDSEALQQAQSASELAPGRADVVRRVQELATRIGELDTALAAARAVVDLVPLDDEEQKLRAHFTLVDLLREAGDIGGAIAQLERVLREHPIHIPAMEGLVELHSARNDWASATRLLYQLVPLAPTAQQRAERLYRLGEVVLVHLGDIDRADDVFLRASDLDPTHVPTLRRLIDVYWRSDDPGAIVEVATELAEKGALSNGPTFDGALARALIAAALLGDTNLATQLATTLADNGPKHIARALADLSGREGRLQLGSASTAIAELARRGLIDLGRLRAAAAGTPAAQELAQQLG